MSFTSTELTPQEWNCLQVALMAPPLWPFAVVAGALGLERAVSECRGPSDETKKLLEEAGYEPVLPPYADMQYLEPAIRLRAAREPKETLVACAQRLGVPWVTARRAMIFWTNYAQTPERYRSRGDLHRHVGKKRRECVVDSRMLGGLE